MIAPGGFVVFTEADFNPTPGTNNSFALNSDGEQVGVWLEGAGFDDVVAWLAALDSRFGVRVVSSVFEAKEAGRVDARLVFEGGA